MYPNFDGLTCGNLPEGAQLVKGRVSARKNCVMDITEIVYVGEGHLLDDVENW